MCIKNQKHITLKRVALLKCWGFLENQLSSKFTWYQHFILKRPPWLNNIYYYFYYYYYYLLTNMELLIRETVGQVLKMKASFRDVNEAIQRSIIVLRITKMGILFRSQNGHKWLLPDNITWTNHDKHLLGMALVVDAKASARSNKYASTLHNKYWKWS